MSKPFLCIIFMPDEWKKRVFLEHRKAHPARWSLGDVSALLTHSAWRIGSKSRGGGGEKSLIYRAGRLIGREKGDILNLESTSLLRGKEQDPKPPLPRFKLSEAVRLFGLVLANV